MFQQARITFVVFSFLCSSITNLFCPLQTSFSPTVRKSPTASYTSPDTKSHTKVIRCDIVIDIDKRHAHRCSGEAIVEIQHETNHSGVNSNHAVRLCEKHLALIRDENGKFTNPFCEFGDQCKNFLHLHRKCTKTHFIPDSIQLCHASNCNLPATRLIKRALAKPRWMDALVLQPEHVCKHSNEQESCYTWLCDEHYKGKSYPERANIGIKPKPTFP